ncbi:hypothetical protein KBB17_03685 [Candidatus Saccharibacteria bacterium]|jgi:hypothetical protein|nr:hypothetical protein [Candidatus Saccharibacteria bacterium]MBP9132346.1 hypothetical protein [Candidatus Saccharibacteria bacterium]
MANNDDSRIVVALAKETSREGSVGKLQITLRTAASSEDLTVDVGKVAETFRGAGGRPHAAGGIQAELDRNSPEDDQLIDLAEFIAAGVKKANEMELAANKD